MSDPEKIHELLKKKEANDKSLVLKRYRERKLSNVKLAEDEFTHFTFLNALWKKFVSTNFYVNQEEGNFLLHVEEYGKDHVLVCSFNLKDLGHLDSMAGKSFNFKDKNIYFEESKYKTAFFKIFLGDKNEENLINTSVGVLFAKVFKVKLSEFVQGGVSLEEYFLDIESEDRFKNFDWKLSGHDLSKIPECEDVYASLKDKVDVHNQNIRELINEVAL
ncbi:MAG: hypothetical protein GY909_15835 [Oligoflexia bacterium]|nr:hypothetical protein [Oligoflexia bacterium]